MAKKIKIDLTYSNGNLWWSADNKNNWAVVGPKSPVTMVDNGANIDWIGDDTIDEVTISFKSDNVLDRPTGGKKDKKAKVKNSCKNGDTCKYDVTVIIAATKESLTLDPDVQVCIPSGTECPPN